MGPAPKGEVQMGGSVANPKNAQKRLCTRAKRGQWARRITTFRLLFRYFLFLFCGKSGGGIPPPKFTARSFPPPLSPEETFPWLSKRERRRGGGESVGALRRGGGGGGGKERQKGPPFLPPPLSVGPSFSSFAFAMQNFSLSSFWQVQGDVGSWERGKTLHA